VKAATVPYPTAGVKERTPLRFRPGWKMTTFVAVLLPLTVALGFWQLRRGAEKEQLEMRFLESQGQLAMAPGSELEPFTRVRLRGRYDPRRYFLLDNQVDQGRVGYAVVGLFLDEDGRVYFVNRGWIPGGPTRETLPIATAPDGTLTLTGLVWKESRLLPWMGDDAWTGRWPERIQAIDLGRMSERVEGAVPTEIRLEPGEPGALTVRNQMPAFSPEKHWGYAVQWFGLAGALVVLYGYFGLRGSS